MTNRSRFAIALAVAAGAFTGVANADVILTATYDDLAGSYTSTGPNTGNFTAVAVNNGPMGLQSAGEVSRTDGNPGNASFEVGFATNGSMAAFVLNCSFVRDGTFPGILGSGTGNFVATDADGDTISGIITGTWVFDVVNSFIYLNAGLSNVRVNDNLPQDGTFNGTQPGNPGSFQIGDFRNLFLEGALTQITFGVGNFFAVAK
jgi:hypothetical protein